MGTPDSELEPHVFAVADRSYRQMMQEERKFYEPVKKTVMRALINSIHGAGKVLPMKLRNFNIIDTYDRATPEYKAAPYDGDVAVIKAVGSPGPPDMGWRKHVRGNLILRNIEMLRFDPGTVVVSGGLHAGDIVVTAGVQALHPGQEVRLLGPAR